MSTGCGGGGGGGRTSRSGSSGSDPSIASACTERSSDWRSFARCASRPGVDCCCEKPDMTGRTPSLSSLNCEKSTAEL
eukprot:1537932-Pyramimonas_sp.AAC.1